MQGARRAKRRLGIVWHSGLRRPGRGCYVLSSRPEDLDAGLVVALQESEQLPGGDPLQAAFDIPRALALRGASGGVGAGFRVIAQADQRDGMQCLVELAVTAAVEAVAHNLPGAGRDGVGSGQGGEGRPRSGTGRHATS